MIIIKKILKKIFCSDLTSDEYINELRKKGILIGDGCRIFDPANTTIDTQNPHMMRIGNNVRITKGCIILTHDYSWAVIAGVYGDILGGIGYVDIGNNVFIGMNSIILKNTTIGDNVIIGAGSIVCGNIECNSVYAGNPAKRIMSLEDFYNKRKNQQVHDVKIISKRYENRYHKKADEKILKEYFWLFSDRKLDINYEFKGLMERTGYGTQCMEKFLTTKPLSSLDELL